MAPTHTTFDTRYEQRQNKHRRSYWVAIVDGKVIAKGATKSAVIFSVKKQELNAFALAKSSKAQVS